MFVYKRSHNTPFAAGKYLASFSFNLPQRRDNCKINQLRLYESRRISKRKCSVLTSPKTCLTAIIKRHVERSLWGVMTQPF